MVSNSGKLNAHALSRTDDHLNPESLPTLAGIRIFDVNGGGTKRLVIQGRHNRTDLEGPAITWVLSQLLREQLSDVIRHLVCCLLYTSDAADE